LEKFVKDSAKKSKFLDFLPGVHFVHSSIGQNKRWVAKYERWVAKFVMRLLAWVESRHLLKNKMGDISKGVANAP
jgi:hypothetical protein